MQDQEGNTALIVAAQEGHDKCVDILIRGGANVNIQDRVGNTSLMWTQGLGHGKYGKCVRLLIIAGADINLSGQYGTRIGRFGWWTQENQKLLFVVGEVAATKKFTRRDSELRLIHLCRASIRNHLLQMSDRNLFARVPKLDLPKPLTKYVLFSEILDEDEDAFLSVCLKDKYVQG